MMSLISSPSRWKVVRKRRRKDLTLLRRKPLTSTSLSSSELSTTTRLTLTARSLTAKRAALSADLVSSWLSITTDITVENATSP